MLAATAGTLATAVAGCSNVLNDDTPEVVVRGDVARARQSWPSFNGHNANAAYSPNGTPVRSEPSAAWRRPVDVSYGYPVVGPKHVFYPDGNALRAFDVEDGIEQWSRTVIDRTDYDLGLTTPPAALFPRINGGDGPFLVVVGVTGERNELRAYTVDGDLAWQTPTPAGGRLVAAPAYDPTTKRVCVGTTAGRVLCVDAPTGEPVWSRRVFGAVEAGPAIDEESVVVTTTAGNVYGLATADGVGRWRASLDAPIHCAPTKAGDLTVLLDDTGRLYGFEGVPGAAWTNAIGAAIQYPGVATDGERAYSVTLGRPGDELVAADLRSGRRRWSVGLGGVDGGNLPAVVDDTIYATASDTLAAFSNGDVGFLEARERWRWQPDGSVTGPVVAAIGRLFVVVSDDGEYELVALE